MNFQELQKILENTTGKKISGSLLADILGGSRQNINQKINNGSEVTVLELQKVEKEFKVSLYKSGVYDGSRQNDTSLDDKIKEFGKRVSELQAQHNFLDREMATLLKISEKDYLKIVVGKVLPTIEVLNNIKRNFNVSIDFLLWG